MKSLWNSKSTRKLKNDSLAMRVHSARLLGQDEDLVLHGGGNNSIKRMEKTIFGLEEILHIKGSGWDLKTIEEAGFAPVRMKALFNMLRLEKLSDAEMVKNLRAAMTNPSAPTPSVEALLHALIPLKFVDHTHADAVLTITNSPNGEKLIRKIYGDSVLIIPYVMPGFILAKEIFTRSRHVNWNKLDGMILMNHGVFTFDDSAKASYEKMIKIVSKAENVLKKKGAIKQLRSKDKPIDPLVIARMRKLVSKKRGHAVLARLNHQPEHISFSAHPRARQIATRGPMTPDHVIRTKRTPVMLNGNIQKEINVFEKKYKDYYKKFKTSKLKPLDPAPRWGVWKGRGTVSFGCSIKEIKIISDIVDHTIKAIQRAEKLGGWAPLPAKDIFDVEYWELEQAKLKKMGAPLPFQGKVALVSGAASGIGKACALNLARKGAAVAALDINPSIKEPFTSNNIVGIQCDLTSENSLLKALQKIIYLFGGIDLVVSNAGTFPKSMRIAQMDQKTWNKSMETNLNSHQKLIHHCVPFLDLGIDPAIVIIGSKNVPAPGPGASAYSVAKAGLTQLARVAALELGSRSIRVNTIHPNAVYDTGIWSEAIIKSRAKNYGMSVQQYKTNNVLSVNISSDEVAELVATMLGPVFSKITGAQIPIDGGNERVI